MSRMDGRGADQLRELKLIPNYLDHADGSVLIEWGKTRVLCACSVDDTLPPWMDRSRPKTDPKGWLTAEYAMLPAASRPRGQRESNAGKIKGRTHEIQRFIGRTLRSAFDLNKLCRKTLIIDCDVIQADGGTRCAAITGAFVAAKLACDKMLANHWIMESPVLNFAAAVSVGIVKDEILVDLCYEEDSAAQVDLNLVMTDSGKIIEVQGIGEEYAFDRGQLNTMLDAGAGAIGQIIAAQKAVFA